MGLATPLTRASGGATCAVARFFRKWAPIGLYLFGSAFLLAKTSFRPAFAPLGCLALLPLFLVIRSFSSVRVAVLSGFWGATYCWMLLAWGPASLELTWSAALALILLPALFAFATRQVVSRYGCFEIILPFAWVLLNLASHAIGVRAGLLSGSVVADSLFAGIAGFGGWAFLAFLLAAINALLLSVVSELKLCWIPSHVSLFLAQLVDRLLITVAGPLTILLIEAVRARGPPDSPLMSEGRWQAVFRS